MLKLRREIDRRLTMMVRVMAASITLCVALCITSGCERSHDSGVSVHDQMMAARTTPAATTGETATQSPSSQPAMAKAPAPSRPVATVNGAPVERKELIDLLIQTHGLPVLQQLVLREAAAQEGRRRGFSLTEQDIEAEYDFTLQAEHLNGKDVEKLTVARRNQMVEEWTRSRAVTREELRVAMERQAWLRKIVGTPAAIDEASLRKEYDRSYGEKVEVRHLQIAAPRFFTQIKGRLDKGESFEALVKEYSQNSTSRDRGGLLPPFSASDETVPAVFVKAVFGLQPGEYTKPVEEQGSYHILKLERRIPAEKITFEEVRDKLHRRLAARRMMDAINDAGTRLIMQADVRIEDASLRDQYKKAQAAGQITGPTLVGQ